MPTVPTRDVPAVDLSSLASFGAELASTVARVASDIALVVGADGLITNVAVGPHSLSAVTEGWIGRRWADTVTEDTSQKIRDLLAEASSGGVSRRREVNLVTGAGSDLPVSYAAVRLGPNGPVLAVGRDLRAVSAIQQRFSDAQQELERDYWKRRRAEVHGRQLLSVATEAVLVAQAASLEVIGQNRPALRLFGEAVGLSLDALVARIADPITASALRTNLSDVRGGTRPALLGLRKAADATELQLSITPLRNDGAELLLARATVVGPAERQDLGQHAVDAVAITDSTGRLQFADAGFVGLFGAADDANLIGRSMFALMPESAESLRQVLVDAKQRGLGSCDRVVVRAANDREAVVDASAVLIDDGDQQRVGFAFLRLAGLGPEQVRTPAMRLADEIAQLGGAGERFGLPELTERVAAIAERHYLTVALERSRGDLARAAADLRMTSEALESLLRARGIDLPGSNGSGGYGSVSRQLN